MKALDNPKISIITPSLNHARFLRETIESIINQTYKCFEHVLVTLSRYIHLNPVKANIVQKPEEYRWSSYNASTDNKLRDL